MAERFVLHSVFGQIESHQNADTAAEQKSECPGELGYSGAGQNLAESGYPELDPIDSESAARAGGKHLIQNNQKPS